MVFDGVLTSDVVDKNVVSSNGSLVSYAAAIELLKNIVGPEQSQDTAETIYFTCLFEKHGHQNG